MSSAPMNPMYHPVAMPMQMPGMPMAPGMGYPQQQQDGPMGPTTDIPNPIGGPGEESYIENILRFNHGKIATIYLTFENNSQWNAKVVRGRIETAGRDHIIISDPQTGKRYVFQMINLDWIEFDGPIVYIAPKLPASVQGQLTQG
ncbi:spore coat protein GerQ [Tumebacillus sp. ITR2]|uniref:Spore coat protein GerQ n=2 Tax=Tumebacillus amylolyticus TaxID=2801339 RepID=A0ABS1J471_9BACL|nr:spore coat protein GerQ [Tumebacillus amylolyticus]